MLNDILNLMKCFPSSYIANDGFLVLYKGKIIGFQTKYLKSRNDIKCELIEWCSRDACKTQFYQQNARNIRIWEELRDSINEYLGTKFSHDDMLEIYTYLGNGINHELTVKFIQSGYNMKILKETE